jgi:hypothetical protein
MWRRSYRDHVVMAFPSYDTATNSWAPQADISWCDGSHRLSEFVRFRERVRSESEAVDFALTRSVLWINEHLKHSRRGRPAGERSPSPAALNRVGLKSRLRVREPSPHKPATVFTYSQFKALLAKIGVSDSERSLHRSYQALLKVRDWRHCSWLDIRKKVEQSREITAAAADSPSRAKKPKLPLTPEAWRRIV